MGLIDRFFGRDSRQATATALLGGGYQASRLGRRLAGWTADRRSINALMSAGGETLRARARQMCRENPYAANAKEAFVSAAVGSGIKPSSTIADAAVKSAVQKAFLAWTDEADADGLTDFYGLQALAAAAMFEAGEVFVRFRPRRPEDGLSVPLQLQLLESEMLPLSHNEELADGRRIVAGIEFDAIGRRTAYHFLRRHPGELIGGFDALNKSVVPAREILHLYRPLRPGQVRGQPGITPGMIRLYLLDQYDDAELERKRVAALFVGFVTRKAPEDQTPLAAASLDPEGLGDTELAPLEPGMLQVLGEGEDITFSEPTEVGGSYEAFQFRTLLAISAAVGLPYHSVTGDVEKANYSSLRASQVEHRRRMDQFQHMTLVFQFCRPIWTRWVETAVLAGAVPISLVDYLRSPAAYTGAKWIPPRWDWVDPAKDRAAELLAVRAGAKTLTSIIEAEGEDADDTLREIARTNDLLDKLGLVLDSDPRKVSRAGLTQARAAGSEIPAVDAPPAPQPD